MKRYSIITNDMKHCYICGTTQNIHKHECIHGIAHRKLSIKYGLVVPLCGVHHNLSKEGVHMDPKKDRELKKIAQQAFEEKYSHEEFMAVFKKNYL